jgi:putative intracellular protease/amidase
VTIKSKTKNLLRAAIVFACLFAVLAFKSCGPIKEFRRWKKYDGDNSFQYHKPTISSDRNNVVIIADNEGTEIFDMLAPFYLFSSTKLCNVFIVAEKRYPIIVRKGLFVLPHYTFSEFDSLELAADLIVIPNLSGMDSSQLSPGVLTWIRENYNSSTTVLSVCDGAITAAASGIYDNVPITTHASDYASLQERFKRPIWVNNVSVTNSGNLYSTAGVSNAVEGSLVVIEKYFGIDAQNNAMKKINYPYSQPKIEHNSVAISLGDKLSILTKTTFRKNKRIGLLLQDGIDEFLLAAILDTHHRSFPKQINSYSVENVPIQSKHGLTIIPTGDISDLDLDEIHVVGESVPKISGLEVRKIQVVMHDQETGYIIDILLKDIDYEYGARFSKIVAILLDYNVHE